MIAKHVPKNDPPLSFKEGVRVLMLINRGVNNSNKGSKRWVNKLITTNPEEFDKAAQKLMELQYHLNDPDVRLYSCVNSRNMQAAIRAFKHRQIDLNDENELGFYARINDSFCSCLMKTENKSERLFLLDVDTKDVTVPMGWMTKNHDILMHYAYPTPNGWHYIVSPFNPILCSEYPDIEVKKDALTLLNWI